jgi:hypothetical protein
VRGQSASCLDLLTVGLLLEVLGHDSRVLLDVLLLKHLHGQLLLLV